MIDIHTDIVDLILVQDHLVKIIAIEKEVVVEVQSIKIEDLTKDTIDMKDMEDMRNNKEADTIDKKEVDMRDIDTKETYVIDKDIIASLDKVDMVIKNIKNEKIVLLETNNSDSQWFMLN